MQALVPIVIHYNLLYYLPHWCFGKGFYFHRTHRKQIQAVLEKKVIGVDETSSESLKNGRTGEWSKLQEREEKSVLEKPSFLMNL